MLAAALAATALRLVASHAYAEGAPAGFSGGFKEDSCYACHFGAEANAAPGRVSIEGVPETFAAGERYTLTVRLHRPGLTLAGFQLAARFAEGGAQAGALAPGPSDAERVRVETQSGIQYANQRKAGTAVGADDEVSWTIEWRAPAGGGAVTFHVAANAADGDGTAEGDVIYTASARSAPGKPEPANGLNQLVR
jgi:hypothetical protein